MDDLKTRLRDLGERVSVGHVVPPAGTYMLKAADRIEELEAALRHVVKSWEEPCYGDDFARLDNVSAGISAARAALEGKHE
jgi:hypothetical protein